MHINETNIFEITEVIVAGVFSVITTLMVIYLGKQQKAVSQISKKLEAVETDFLFLNEALKPTVDLVAWGKVANKIQQFCRETSIDRFMILVCWNGQITPTKTTAIYQYRENPADFHSYIGVDLDKDYIERLVLLKYSGYHEFTVANEPDSVIKRIYEAEGIKHALWFPLQAVKSTVTSAYAFRYCSFATKANTSITPALRQRCQNLVWEIKSDLDVYKQQHAIAVEIL